jgi:N-acetyltransferase
VIELYPVDPDRDADGLFVALDHDAVWTRVAGRPGSAEALRRRLPRRLPQVGCHGFVRLRRAHAGIAAGTTSYLAVDVSAARLEIEATAYAQPSGQVR